MLNQFTLIKDRPQLNTKRQDLGDKTPLKYFAEYINNNIFQAIISNGREDYLGRFYGEFVSYSGGDGQALGVVLTPRHITELFCELVDLKPTDVIFDKTTPRLIQFHTLKNAVNPPLLGGFSIFGTVAA